MECDTDKDNNIIIKIMESKKVYLIYEDEDHPYDTSRIIGCAMTKEKAAEICADLRRDYEKKANSNLYADDARKFNDWLWENNLQDSPNYFDLVAEHFGVDKEYAEKVLEYGPSTRMIFYFISCDVIG